MQVRPHRRAHLIRHTFWISLASATSCNSWKVSARSGVGRALPRMAPPHTLTVLPYDQGKFVLRHEFLGGDHMVPEPELVTQSILPTQVWALIPPERQQHVLRLLAHLAVHLITAQAPCRWSAIVAKERSDDHPFNSHQDPA
jgi:hypothetical protein